MTSPASPAWLVLPLILACAACGNVTYYNDHSAASAADYASYEAPPAAEEAQAQCETVRTMAGVDATLSTTVAILGLMSGHRRGRWIGLNGAARAASDLPAATMNCPLDK
jgi:hypothetical protein